MFCIVHHLNVQESYSSSPVFISWLEIRILIESLEKTHQMYLNASDLPQLQRQLLEFNTLIDRI